MRGWVSPPPFLSLFLDLFFVHCTRILTIFFSQIGGFVATFKPKGTLIQCMFISPRQGEFLHDLAVIYESITGIDHWWIGLSDVGELKITIAKCAFDYLNKQKYKEKN